MIKKLSNVVTAQAIFATLTFVSSSISAQTTEFQGTVTLRQLAHVFKVVTVPNSPHTYLPLAGTTGTTITYETKLTNNKTDIVIKDVINPVGAGPFTINANLVRKIPMSPYSNGKANLYIEDKDKSVLYVNYWLNDINTVAAGITIEKWQPVYGPAGAPVMTKDPTATRILISPEKFYLMRVNPGSPEIATTWFANSEQIRVLNAAGGIDYYLVNRYDRNAKYILELQNREHIAYSSKSLDLGALTIPFKYRFGFKKDNLEVEDDVTASFNIGAYGGYKLTKYSIINKAGTYTNRTFLSLRAGPFINLSTATLDSVSTTVGKVPKKKDDKQNIAVLSTGLGLMFDIKGLQMGIYGGWDFGVGSEATNWNYHKRFWLGYGIGYKITDLFAKKD